MVSDFRQVIVNEESAQATEEFLSKRLAAIKNQRSTGELEDLALVIGAYSLCLLPAVIDIPPQTARA